MNASPLVAVRRVLDWTYSLPIRLKLWIETAHPMLPRPGGGRQAGAPTAPRGAWGGALSPPRRQDAGQTVAEYALVLLVAAAIAAAFLFWAKQSGRLDAFFDLIFDRLLSSVDPSPTPGP